MLGTSASLLIFRDKGSHRFIIRPAEPGTDRIRPLTVMLSHACAEATSPFANHHNASKTEVKAAHAIQLERSRAPEVRAPEVVVTSAMQFWSEQKGTSPPADSSTDEALACARF